MRATLQRARTEAVRGVAEAAGRPSFFGVPGLDDLLPSTGLVPGTQVMVIGETGVGKTVLAAQFLYEGLLVGDTCIYVACDEPANRMRLSMAGLRLGTIAYERAGQLIFVDAYARERSNEQIVVPNPGNLDEYFSYERQTIALVEGRRLRLVVDSLSTLFSTTSRETVLEFNRDRLRYLGFHRVLTLDNYVTGLLNEQTVAGLSHAYPMIVKLGFIGFDGEVERYLQLGKVRSGMFSGERRQYRIDPRAGIVARR